MSDEHGTGEQPATPEQSPRPRPQAPLEPVNLDDPWLLDRVLSGDAGDEWSSLAELFAAASGPAESDEVDGERGAVQSFMAAREAAAVGRERARGASGHAARRVAVVSTLMAGKFAAVTVAGIVTLGAGGMAAAAYTGLLPAPLQDVAHRTIGAPLPERSTLSPSTSTSSTPTPTPEATSSSSTTTRVQQSDTSTTTTSTAEQTVTSTAELCVDWQQQQLAATDPEFTSLTLAASGSTSIDAFCASLTSPTTEPAPEPQATPTIDPTATPSDTSSPTSPPESPSPTSASDTSPPPPMTASDEPTAPPTELPTTEPTGP
jgi:hypothetical protein